MTRPYSSSRPRVMRLRLRMRLRTKHFRSGCAVWLCGPRGMEGLRTGTQEHLRYQPGVRGASGLRRSWLLEGRCRTTRKASAESTHPYNRIVRAVSGLPPLAHVRAIRPPTRLTSLHRGVSRVFSGTLNVQARSQLPSGSSSDRPETHTATPTWVGR